MSLYRLLVATALLMPAAAASESDLIAPTTAELLQRFVEDYAQDPMQSSLVFGLEVDGRRWHVISDASRQHVELRDGFPDQPLFYFTLSRELLERIDQGRISGLTAMAAETSEQVTPLDVLPANGFERPDDYDAVLRPLIFHFWTRGRPETVPLGREHSRVVHGAPGTVMYYADGFRSAVYNVPPNVGPDAAPTMTVPFPRILVVLQGTMNGIVGGEAFSIGSGEMVFLPPGVPAQVWNERDELLQMMFLMFGEGA